MRKEESTTAQQQHTHWMGSILSSLSMPSLPSLSLLRFRRSHFRLSTSQLPTNHRRTPTSAIPTHAHTQRHIPRATKVQHKTSTCEDTVCCAVRVCCYLMVPWSLSALPLLLRLRFLLVPRARKVHHMTGESNSHYNIRVCACSLVCVESYSTPPLLL